MALFFREDNSFDMSRRMTGFDRYRQLMSFYALRWTVVNLLTVSAAAADDLEGHITAVAAAGRKGVVMRNAADSEGRVTFSAVFSRKGLIISFH